MLLLSQFRVLGSPNKWKMCRTFSLLAMLWYETNLKGSANFVLPFNILWSTTFTNCLF